MSYYSSNYSSASLLDPYCAGGSRYNSTSVGDSLFDKKDNYYGSSYSSPYGNSAALATDYLSTSRTARPTAYDRYVSYLADELTSSSIHPTASTRRYIINLIFTWGTLIMDKKM